MIIMQNSSRLKFHEKYNIIAINIYENENKVIGFDAESELNKFIVKQYIKPDIKREFYFFIYSIVFENMKLKFIWNDNNGLKCVCAILETPFHMDIDFSLIVIAKKIAKDATNHLSDMSQ